jgi:hypothetical protein
MSRGLCSLALLVLLTGACDRRNSPPRGPDDKDRGDLSPSVVPPENPLKLSELPFPTTEARLKLFDDVVSEMARLDGEGLEARRLRPESWSETLQGLRRELHQAENFKDLARVFGRVDASYTNLHSSVDFVAQGAWFASGTVRPRAWVSTKISERGQASFHLEVDDAKWGTPSLLGLRSGDEVVAINGRTTLEWSRENFNFCKFPLLTQCDEELFENLVSETLSWQRGSALVVTVRDSGGQTVTLDIPYEIRSSTPEERQQRELERNKRLECVRSPERYPGFHLVYAGNRACLFEKDGDSSVALLRITSFSYSERRLFPEQKIRSVRQEVALMEPVWQREAGHWQHLVVDVIDNTGGNAPIPYYRLLFTEDFQEQYYRLRKVSEMEDPEFLDGLLWSDPAQLRTYENLRSEGVWQKTPLGDFLPPVPMFCSDDESDCRKSLFSPKSHPFRGRVSLLMNRLCVSSCDGFVWGVKKVMGKQVKLFGLPQAADSTYSRARIDVEWTKDSGYFTRAVNEHSPYSSNVVFSQIVAVSLSTDVEGRSIAGRPLLLDRWVGLDPFADKNWPAKVLAEALQVSAPSRR